MADTKEVTLDVRITRLQDAECNEYKVNIRHEGISESKQFVSLLEDIVKASEDEQIFRIKRITLISLQKANKVDFFGKFGAHSHKEWKLVDITNVTLNKNEFVIDNDDDESMNELRENEPTGKLMVQLWRCPSGSGPRQRKAVPEGQSRDRKRHRGPDPRQCR